MRGDLAAIPRPRSPETMHALAEKGVRYIGLRSVGYDMIDLDVARELGIRVSNASYSPDSVAEYTVMMMLMSMRRMKIVQSHAGVHDFSLNGICGTILAGSTVGVIGTGRIGTMVAHILHGFGAHVLGSDPHPRDIEGVENVSLDELLRRSDVIQLTCPSLGVESPYDRR